MEVVNVNIIFYNISEVIYSQMIIHLVLFFFKIVLVSKLQHAVMHKLGRYF